MDISEWKHDPLVERITDFLISKLRSSSSKFPRVMTAYHLAKMAAAQQCMIKTLDRGVIPVNLYSINFAPSGFGKGLSLALLDEHVFRGFKDMYSTDALPYSETKNLSRLSALRAGQENINIVDAEKLVAADFQRAGPFLMEFDSATIPAVKQMRNKIQMAGLGSVSLEIDEFGNKLLNEQEVLTAFLELYDIGQIKEKLTKNTNDNLRTYALKSPTPTNLLLFGTHKAVLDGGNVEAGFRAMLQSGFGRRCLFAFEPDSQRREIGSARELLTQMQNNSGNSVVDLYDQFEELGEAHHSNKMLNVNEEVTLLYLEYLLWCEKRASDMCPESQELEITELEHRYFKALKLAGAFAFAHMSLDITVEHMQSAIKLVEESGDMYHELLKVEPAYARIATYLGSQSHRELTQTEMLSEMPYYRGSQTVRKELLQLATAWGYRNGVLLKHNEVDGIELYTGKPIVETDMNALSLSYGIHPAHRWTSVTAKWANLPNLFSRQDFNFCTHQLERDPSVATDKDNCLPRAEENLIPGCELVVLDIDEGVSMTQAQVLLKDFTYYMYPTKSHRKPKGPNNHVCDRFRIVLPLSHRFDSTEEYREFLDNIYAWLPFDVDTATKDPCRKWACNGGATVIANEGRPLDTLKFIPRTSKCVREKTKQASLADLERIERWYVTQASAGEGRNNQLAKYAFYLVDGGADYPTVSVKVKDLNRKFEHPLSETQIDRTVLVSAQKRISKRNQSGN